MPSVAGRITLKLEGRLLAVDGSGRFESDVGGRVYLRRPSYDVANEELPAYFLWHSTDEREGKPEATTIEKRGSWNLVGVVKQTERAGEQVDALLADAERALELPTDLFLHDVAAGANLLTEPLLLVSSEYELPEDASGVEAFALGIECVFPHTYGDPDHVEK